MTAISVIIAVRNEAPQIVDFTVAQISKELRKTFGENDWEIILINDDDNPEVPGKHLGIASARNLGASRASGDILLFTDAHVHFWCPTAFCTVFEQVHKGLHTSNSGIIGSTTQLVTSIEAFLDTIHGLPYRLGFGAQYRGWYVGIESDLAALPILEEMESRKLTTVPYVGGAFFALKKSTFEFLGGFFDGFTGSENFGDAELCFMAHAAGLPVQIIPEIVCYHLSISTGTPIPTPSTEQLSGRCSLDCWRYEDCLMNALRACFIHFDPSTVNRMLTEVLPQYPQSQRMLREDYSKNRVRELNCIQAIFHRSEKLIQIRKVDRDKLVPFFIGEHQLIDSGVDVR